MYYSDPAGRFGPQKMSYDLKAGGVTQIDGFDAQRLRICLPPAHQRCWSKDGNILYVESPVLDDTGNLLAATSEVLRIDTEDWTSHVSFAYWHPGAGNFEVSGMTMTSEGLFVAISGVYHISWTQLPDQPEFPVYVRHLLLLDPDTMELKRTFMAPYEAVTGSADSPIVCLSGPSVLAALVDVRDGKVLRNITSENMEQTLPGVTFIGNFVMSQDGKFLYLRTDGHRVAQMDISGGEFRLLQFLKFFEGGDKLCLTPDGGELALSNYAGFRERGSLTTLSTASTLNPNIDPPTPTNSKVEELHDVAFFGPSNRLAYSTHSPSPDDARFQLSTDVNHWNFDYFCNTSQMERTSLCGLPNSDEVLVGAPLDLTDRDAGIERFTYCVAVPPASSTASGKANQSDVVEILPPTIIGEAPEDPLLLLDLTDRTETSYDDGIATLEMNGERLVCSPDGKWVYMSLEDGLLFAFDTQRLCEVRRAKIADAGAFSSEYQLSVTKVGLLVASPDGRTVELLDFETLTGIRRYNIEAERILASSPGSSLVQLQSKTDDFELFDLEQQRLAYRMARTEAPELYRRNFNDEFGTLGEVTISGTGELIFVNGKEGLLCYQFDPDGSLIERGKLELRGVPVALADKKTLYVNEGDRVSVYQLDSLPEPVNVLHKNGWEVAAVAPNGWVYFTEANSSDTDRDRTNRVVVWNEKGEEIYQDSAIARRNEFTAIPVPGRPSRLFSISPILAAYDFANPTQFYELRVWESGSHQAAARLISFDEKNVVLASAEGKQTTIPIARLSKEDVDYVNAKKPKKRKKR